MRLLIIACFLTAACSAASAALPAGTITLPGVCAPNSRVGEGNALQDQWMLSHQLARPFHCTRAMIEPQTDGTTWIVFDSGVDARKSGKPLMVFIGSASAPTGGEIDVTGGQAYYGDFRGDTYAWGGQVTCSIHFPGDRSTEGPYKVTCTAIVHRGSDEKIMAAILDGGLKRK